MALSRPCVAFATAVDRAFDPDKILYMVQAVEALFMAQHFLLSAAARSLSPAKVMRMSDLGADRWQTGLSELRLPDLLRLSPLGKPASLALQGMSRRFLGDVGTLFAWHKVPLKT